MTPSSTTELSPTIPSPGSDILLGWPIDTFATQHGQEDLSFPSKPSSPCILSVSVDKISLHPIEHACSLGFNFDSSLSSLPTFRLWPNSKCLQSALWLCSLLFPFPHFLSCPCSELWSSLYHPIICFLKRLHYFFFAAPCTWNCLPLHIQNAAPLSNPALRCIFPKMPLAIWTCLECEHRLT